MDELKEYYETVFNKDGFMPQFNDLNERQIKVVKDSHGFSSWKFNVAFENLKSDLKNSKFYKWLIKEKK